MAHTEHVPADFVSTFRQRFAPLFGRKIARQRAEQYLGGLLGGRAERRNVTALAGTVDGATARALGWLLNKSPWPTRPIVDALQMYVGETLGGPDGLFTLNLDSFVKRGDNAVGVEKQYAHHLGRTLNCQIGVFLAYGAGHGSALVDAALYMPHAWIDGAARRQKAGVPDTVQYQPRSELAIELLKRARAAGRLPGEWVTSWHGEGFEADLRARLDAEGWRYLLPIAWTAPFFGSPDAAESRPASELVAAEPGAPLSLCRVWESSADAERHPCWLVSCTDELTGTPVAFVSNAPADDATETLTRIVAARWDTARMLAARCAGVSLDVYRVRGWDGWHRHVALALLASAFRACLPVGPAADATVDPTDFVPEAPAVSDLLAPAEMEPIELMVEDRAEPIDETVAPAAAAPVPFVAEAAPSESPVAAETTYRLVVDLQETDWRAVRALQVWLVADENGTILSSSPTKSDIENQQVGPTMEVHFESALTVEQILAALDEVPEIVVAELALSGAESAAPAVADAVAVEADDADDLLAALAAELSARTTAREAGLMPAFEGPRAVIGNALEEGTHLNEANRQPAPAEPSAGPAAVAIANRLASVAPPSAPPAEARVAPAAASKLAPAPVPSVPAPESPAQAIKAEEPARKEQEKARPSEEQMVVLDVGDEMYGIPVQRVREIIRVPPITRVPNGPAFLEGVINLRGQVIPVMDLRKHLGIPSVDETKSSRVVVSELGRHTVGLMVDGVSQVVMVATNEIEPPPALVAGVQDGQVCGVARLGERLVLFLDPDRVLPNR